MKGSQLLEQLRGFGDIDVQESSVRGWIDSGQKEASLDLPVVRTITTNNVVAGTIVSVTTGIFKVMSAICEDGEYPLTSIKVQSASLVFLEMADFVTVTFSSLATDFTVMSDELTIHPAIQAVMIYYLISMYYDTEGEGDSEESGLAERYYQRWLYHKSMAIAALTDSGLDLGIRDPVETTDVLPRSRGRQLVEDPYYE